MTPLNLDPDRLAELHDRARAEAEALRREVLDDFWRGANAALSTTGAQALRAARRLAHRLQRHRALARGQV
jgi:hypothetical protein